MEGYIVSATYRIINDRPIIHLFGRLKNSESFIAKIPFKPYFYIDEKDKSLLDDSYLRETKLVNFKEGNLMCVTLKKPQEVPILRKQIEDAGGTTYEADIRFVQRFYMDNEIMGTIKLSGDYEKGEKADRIYDNPKIDSVPEYKVNLKTLAFDIETDKRALKVYSISIVCDNLKEVHILSKRKVKNAVVYKSEKELLTSFIERINDIDPDIITGWNVIDFDFKVLDKRLKEYKIPFNIGRLDEPAKIRIQHDFFRESTASVLGRIVFDGISLLKQAWITLPNYKLDTAAHELLGEHKIELEEDFWENFEDIIKNDPERVAEYNLWDSVLVIKILKKKKLLDLVIKKSLMTGLQLDRVRGSIASLDSLYLRQAKKKGYVCPNSQYNQRTERIKGAYVMEPKPGIYDYVAVLDFKSLYPSIIRTYNIDPISHAKGGTIVAPNNARFENSEGILPKIIEILGKERDKAKSEKDTTKSHAIKIIMNSFYGVLANPTCRFYSLDMGNAITSFARETIKETTRLIEKKGFEVLYGDTDSVFVNLKVDSQKSADETSRKIAKEINKYFKDKIKKEFDRNSVLELEYEKTFKVLMLPQMRGGKTGAKKRYAGLLINEKGKEEMTVTGMEIVRRDWTELAKTVQLEMLNRVFHKKEVAKYIKKIVDELKQGKHDDKLIYRKNLRKDLSAYVKTTPPHVKAARMLPKVTSKIIEYYITVDGPVPVEIVEQKNIKLDYEHYIEKQIKPIAETILSLFNQNFDDVIQDAKQKNLFDY